MSTPAQMWPDYLLDRARRRPSKENHIIPGSTAVVSFGHPLKPEVATLGINPSSAEFLAKDRTLLTGPKRRLATLESLATTYKQLDRDAAGQVISECAAYFNRQPYHWFKVLNQILASALSVSYQEGTACHLDLVQWATDPVWKGLEDTTRARLLSDDRPFLVQQLRREGYRLIVVAGRTAMAWVQQAGLVRWISTVRLEGNPAAAFSIGDTAMPRFVGWSCNLQSQPGARAHIPSLIDLLDRHSEARPLGDAALETSELIPKGTHFRARRDLISELERWLQRSEASTIGDVSRFPRAPWINLESSVGLVDLNADTQRGAIEQMIRHVHLNPSADWYVVPNQRGRVNKVLYSRDDSVRGWYAYLRRPLPEPSTLRDVH